MPEMIDRFEPKQGGGWQLGRPNPFAVDKYAMLSKVLPNRLHTTS